MLASPFRLALAISLVAILPTHAGPPKQLQSQVKGLLVVQLPNGSFAGAASQMNATAIPIPSERNFEIRFNQQVGPMMYGATQEVLKLMQVRHQKDLPYGHRIEFGFADKHTPKDGPSAAVACALMVESIITGEAIDPSLAVTGDLTATGEVRPIGGVGAKLRGATKRDSKIIAVPAANKSAIDDIYVYEGVSAIAGIQVILIETFDQAWQIGKANKSPEITQALKDYETVQAAVVRSAGNASHPKVLEKLKTILQAIPNHESARLIALHGMGKGPKKLSLAGSLDSIQTAATQLNETLRSGSFSDQGKSDPLWDNVTTLTKLRNDVDPRTKNYLDAFLNTATIVKNNRERNQMPASVVRDFQTSISRIQDEEKKLMNDTSVREELMNQ